MKEAHLIDINLAMESLNQYDCVIDVRSTGEFQIDHLPGATNYAVLNDSERAFVGTTNAQESAFAAKRQGAALLAINIGNLLNGPLADKPHGWKPLIYCWRGGNRSGSLATVLARIGWRTTVVEGGYRAYRRWVIDQIAALAPQPSYLVVAGRTGSGKSKILQAIADQGGQVLDLEGLANHRGSVLGLLPNDVQPSQKMFESRLAQALRSFDISKPVFVESESRKIGRVQIPDAMINSMRGSRCIVIDFPVQIRTQFLVGDYQHFLADPSLLLAQLARLQTLHGAAKIQEWTELIHSGQWGPLVQDLLQAHYDPAYDRSMNRNYQQLNHAVNIVWDDQQPDFTSAFESIAKQLLAMPLVTAG